MARPKSLDKCRDVCPSCKTRLRISLHENDRVECPCPECNAPLIAQLGKNDAVEVSVRAATNPETSSRKTAPAWSTSYWSGKSRTVAAAVTVFFGILIVAAISHSDNEPQPEPESDPATTVGSAAQKLPEQQSPADTHQKTEVSDLASATSPGRTVDLPQKTPPETAKAGPPDSPSDAAEALKASQVEPENSSVLLVAGTETPAESSTQPIPNSDNIPELADVGPPANPTAVPRPTPKPMSLRQRLGISIRSFRQEKPIPLRDLIQTIEKMCQVRVDVSTVSDIHLDQQITLSLFATTPVDILTEAGQKCGLRVIVAENSIQLISETD